MQPNSEITLFNSELNRHTKISLSANHAVVQITEVTDFSSLMVNVNINIAATLPIILYKLGVQVFLTKCSVTVYLDPLTGFGDFTVLYLNLVLTLL